MRILRAGALYFAVVFGSGFLLGTIRTLVIVPRLGSRTAELMEAPIMLVVTILAARWVVRRRSLPTAPAVRLGVGVLALAFLLIAEFSFVLAIRGLTLREYVASRDPVTGTVYVALLCVFAAMPLLVARN